MEAEEGGRASGCREQRRRCIRLPAPPSAVACLFDQRLLLTQPLEYRGVVNAIVWRTRRNANSRVACPSTGPSERGRLLGRVLGEVMDDSDQFVGLVAVLSGEADEFVGSCDHGALFGRAGDGDAAAAAELEQSLVA